MSTPMTLVFELWFGFLVSSVPLIGSVLLVTLGVGLMSINAFKLNVVGAFIAILASVTQTLTIIAFGQTQKRLNISAQQLLYYTAPASALINLLFFPMVNFSDFTLNWNLTGYVLLSCVFAVGIQISSTIFLAISSGTTYMILTNFKTVVIVIMGFAVFNEDLSLKGWLGLILGVVGMIWHSMIRSAPKPDTSAKQTELTSVSVAKPLSNDLPDPEEFDTEDKPLISNNASSDLTLERKLSTRSN